MFGSGSSEAVPVVTCHCNFFSGWNRARHRNLTLLSCRAVQWSWFAFYFSSSFPSLALCHMKTRSGLWNYCPQAVVILFVCLWWWDLTSQWWLGAVGTSCSCCTHSSVSGSAELGVCLGWHTGWWNVRFLMVIKFTKGRRTQNNKKKRKTKPMADVSFCQSRTESLKCAVMYSERVSVNAIPVSLSGAWGTETIHGGVTDHVVWMPDYQASLLECRAWILWIWIALIQNEKTTYSAWVKIAW